MIVLVDDRKVEWWIFVVFHRFSISSSVGSCLECYSIPGMAVDCVLANELFVGSYVAVLINVIAVLEY